MSISKEQVEALQPGDVVELRLTSGSTVCGPLKDEHGYLTIDGAGWNVRSPGGGLPFHIGDGVRDLTVVSRVPRPLYVNHPRTEPIEGDIVRDCEGDAWGFQRGEWWCASPDASDDGDPIVCYRPLTLLVDGETGQVVPSGQPADPLGHVRTGDPTPESANDEPPCSAGANNFACTRERGHVGQHIAGTGVRNPVAAVWS